MSSNSSNNILDSSSDVESNVNLCQSETNNNGIPPMPHKKPSTRVFRKMDKVEMNQMPSPGNKRIPLESSTDQASPTLKPEGLDEFDNNGYLTPSDPPPYTDTSFRFSNPEKLMPVSQSSMKQNGRQFQRFDSGVGDCESDRGSSSLRFSTSPSMSSSGSMSNPRLSTQYEQTYEDIDEYHRAHQQKKQKQPQPRSSTDKFAPNDLPPIRNGLRPLPPVNIRGVTHSESEDYDNGMNASIAETVSRSCNITQNGTLPHTYMPLDTNGQVVMQKSPAKSQACNCGLVIALIIIFLISMAALVLSIYVLISRPDTSAPQVVQAQSVGTQTETIVPTVPGMPGFEQALAPLREEITQLKQENALLKEILMAQQENFTSYVEPLQEEVIQLSTSQNNLSQSVQSMEIKFDAAIANISLTPGPQGSPGVADFSLCKFESIIGSYPAHAELTSDTAYLPSEEDVQNYFVIFAYCTYSGANQSALEAKQNSRTSHYRYRCKCWGDIGEKYTSCTLHVWMCPYIQGKRISSVP